MKKQLRSFGYAFKGIFSALKSERNMKIHAVALCVVLLCGFLLQINKTEWFACIVCFALVVSAELFNTAIESVVDLVSPDYHPLAEKSKDIAAGAVLFTAIMSAVIGAFIFLPKIIVLL